ncbi:MAG TPA: pyridoxal phosphate-dependent aminotransferase [Candidatus Merdenecus merdavium]|nr:pyridoxal phosphate-dependent aminotransferase [Candidatus Merdenecus merdavium]
MYNFDQLESRKGTMSLKYDCNAKRGMPEDVDSFWVADMDFPAPKEVQEALIDRCHHGIFGYTEPDDEYYQALDGWFFRKHQLHIEPETVVMTPGVVYAINMAVRAYTEPGDGVMIQKPVYYPFFQTIKVTGRKVVNSPLVYEQGHYVMDVEDFERKIVEEKVKLFILCSPHNPVGRVWTKEELEKVADICYQHNVIIVSDEIHCDFVFEGKKHIPLINIKEEYKDITITCTAPSKTFNLAGLNHSNNIIPNKELRKKFQQEINQCGGSNYSLMGIIATKAAYTYGDQWLQEVQDYLAFNVKFIKEYLGEHLPKVKVVEPEGTYLLWLDFTAYGLTGEELDKKIIYEAKLWLDGGTMFGAEGAGFQRINIATSTSKIKGALDAIIRVFA